MNPDHSRTSRRPHVVETFNGIPLSLVPSCPLHILKPEHYDDRGRCACRVQPVEESCPLHASCSCLVWEEERPDDSHAVREAELEDAL